MNTYTHGAQAFPGRMGGFCIGRQRSTGHWINPVSVSSGLEFPDPCLYRSQRPGSLKSFHAMQMHDPLVPPFPSHLMGNHVQVRLPLHGTFRVTMWLLVSRIAVSRAKFRGCREVVSRGSCTGLSRVMCTLRRRGRPSCLAFPKGQNLILLYGARGDRVAVLAGEGCRHPGLISARP